MIKRWIENIKWLFSHPPTSLTSDCTKPCDYCGAAIDACQGLWQTGRYCVCGRCVKKVLDSVLKSDTNDA